MASGAGALNQFFERSFDAQMKRTARRPLASGRVKPMDVLWFGVSLSLVGAVYLALGVNVLSASLAVATLLSYLLLYTPLKRKTPLCTLVGAFPGAAPPLIGWAAARGHLDPMAWVLYALVFLWQFPHFMAIAWMYREDYSRAGYLAAIGRLEEFLRKLANPRRFAGSHPRQPDSCADAPPRPRLFGWWGGHGIDLLLLRCELCYS